MKKAFGFGDSILLQSNHVLKKSFEAYNISYEHLVCGSHDIDLNIARDCNVGPLTRLNLYIDDLILSKKTYDFVVIHLGLHDIKFFGDNQFLTDIDTYERTFKEVIGQLFLITKKIYWCAIPFIFDQHHNQKNLGMTRHAENAEAYNMRIKKHIKQDDIIWIDTYHFMKGLSEAYLIDHVHLTEEGIKLYTAFILNEIKKKEINDET